MRKHTHTEAVGTRATTRHEWRLDLRLCPPNKRYSMCPAWGMGNKCKTEQALPLRSFRACRRKPSIMTEVKHF